MKAKPAATNINAMRSTMGLVSSFTATPSTSEEAVAIEESDHGHAAEKNAKGHLMAAQRNRRRFPGPPSGVAGGFMIEFHAPAGALDPNRQHGGHTKQRSRDRAEKSVKMVSLAPRNAPTIAISFTSPKPMPSTPRARR